ncbi:MAG: hypothetical protein ACPL5I_11485 [Thermodesulfobacteriota bacterium]
MVGKSVRLDSEKNDINAQSILISPRLPLPEPYNAICQKVINGQRLLLTVDQF